MYILQGEKKLRSIWKKDPVKFGMDIFPQYFNNAPGALHPALAHDLLNPKKLYTIIMITREGAKTVYAAALMPIHKMLFKNLHYAVIASYSLTKAGQSLNDIQVMLQSERFLNEFGDFKPPSTDKLPWNTKEMVAKSEKHDRICMFQTRSEDSQVAGIRFQNWRPQLFVADDMEDEGTVKNDDLTEKKFKWLQETVKFAMDASFKEIFVVGTVYKGSSMLVQMSKLKRNVHVIKYPMLADKKTADKLNKYLPEYNKYARKGFEILPIQQGESVWEARHPTAVILKEKEDAAANGTLAAWMRQRQQMDTANEATRFNEEDIKVYDPKDVAGVTMNFYILTDIAYKKGRKNDETGIVAFGVDKNEQIYIFEAIKGRWGDREFVQKFIGVLLKYYKDPDKNIKFGGIESYAFSFINSLLKIGLNEAGLSLYIRELKPASRKKEDRMRAMIPYNEKWQIHIQKKHYEFKEEMLRFHGEADQKGLNMLDAFSYYPDVCNKAAVEEETGLGSVANKEAWGKFINKMGPKIGGGAGRRANAENTRQIQQSWY